MSFENLKDIEKEVQQCKSCPLYISRNNVVFSDGSNKAKIMLIGEAPGADEDKQGKPFVGRAGKLLNEFLKLAGINRNEDLYIANTIKCRPPENRKPQKEEKAACEKFLHAQINTVKPKIIVLCGATAMESFLDKKLKISKVRGEFFENIKGYEGIKFIPILHPSYLLRQHSTETGSPRDLTLKDLIKIKKTALD